MSKHSATIITIHSIEKHPNADALEIIHILGWQVVVRKGQFAPGQLAIYVEPDYMVPVEDPLFAFLSAKAKDGYHRLRAVRLRGVLSYGLLVSVPPAFNTLKEGADVLDLLRIRRYEPTVLYTNAPGDACAGPDLGILKFDIENLQNYPDVLNLGENVVITEKLHGTNARFVFWKNEFFVGSRNMWLRRPAVGAASKSWWWATAEKYPGIEAYCRANPGHVVFGEIYGDVQNMRYGHKLGEISFAAFAILFAPHRAWIDYADIVVRMQAVAVPLAPLLYAGPYHPGVIDIAEESSRAVINDAEESISEGIVIVPARERCDSTTGRVALKHISRNYWLAK